MQQDAHILLCLCEDKGNVNRTIRLYRTNVNDEAKDNELKDKHNDNYHIGRTYFDIR